MIALTLYSRPGCHLCEEMKAVIERVARAMPLSVDEIDISTDPEIERRCRLEIPVLMVNVEKAVRYRLTEAELTRILTGRCGEATPPSPRNEGAGR